MPAIGKVIALNKVDLSTVSSGYVSWFPEVASKIKKGEKLIVLENRQLEFDLQVKQAQVTQLKEKIAYTENQVKRFSKLYTLKNGTLNELELAEHELSVLKAELSIALSKLSEVQYQIQNLVITAPFDGVVSDRHTGLHQFEPANTKLLTFIGSVERSLEILVSSKHLERINSHTTVTFNSRFGAFTLPVAAIIPQIDDTTSMFRVRIPLPDEPWFDNELIRVNIVFTE